MNCFDLRLVTCFTISIVCGQFLSVIEKPRNAFQSDGRSERVFGTKDKNVHTHTFVFSVCRLRIDENLMIRELKIKNSDNRMPTTNTKMIRKQQTARVTIIRND